jgi:hypothetical protein
MPAMFGQDWRAAMRAPQASPQGGAFPTRGPGGGWQMPQMPLPSAPPVMQQPAPQMPAPMMGIQPQANTWASANGRWTPQGMQYPVETLGWFNGSGR